MTGGGLVFELGEKRREDGDNFLKNTSDENT